MAHELVRYVCELLDDPAKQDDFYADPKKEMDDRGLTNEQQWAIMSRDPKKIGEAIAKDLETQIKPRWT
jgi:hypothetical protein